MKRCPRCQLGLAEARIGPVQVDGCSACGGVWFDNAELGAVANAESNNLLALEDQFLHGMSSPELHSQTICPNCNVKMFDFEFPHSPGVRLDACPQCKGVWADDGELKAIYAHMTGHTTGEVEPMEDSRRIGRQAIGVLLSNTCPQCRAQNSSMALHCRVCSQRLPHSGTMLCPNCDVILSRRAFRGLTLDVCPDCTGTWLDAGELSALAEFTPEELRQVQDDAAAKRTGVSALWNANPTLMCPRCCVSLAAPAMLFGADVPLDSCVHCNGVWVGAGNMAAISRHYRQTLGRRQPLA